MAFYFAFTNFASDTPNKRSNRELILQMRSNSVDRFNETAKKKSELLANLRKFTSFDEHNRLTSVQNRVPGLAPVPPWESEVCGEAVVKCLGKFNKHMSMYIKM